MMIRKISAGLMVLASVALLAQPAAAQGFGPGYMDVGPTVGFGSLGGANLAFGGRFEMALKPIPALASLGNGMLGIQVGATYYSYSNPYWSFKYIPIGVTANYHFKLADAKIDPFVGAGLGYQVVTCSGAGLLGLSCGSSSSVYFIGRAGVRYFLTPKLAAYGDVGAGGALVNVGVMLRLK
jgi:hypothetical protein